MHSNPDAEREGFDLLIFVDGKIRDLPVLDIAHPCREVERQRQRRGVLAVHMLRRTRLPPDAVVVRAEAQPDQRGAEVERRAPRLREVEVVHLRRDRRIQRQALREWKMFPWPCRCSRNRRGGGGSRKWQGGDGKAGEVHVSDRLRGGFFEVLPHGIAEFLRGAVALSQGLL